ncbi:hypothetical protein AVL61_09810 [Kocuria rosea subsp. polaris]|uniref:DUF3071 domain-containing protein n=1 Tax=Kocuria rosea subsp. polaris TaxID=136273 RepID=A0A0W8IM69_KOCRO|nr:septation protein SepH [Kocuria polaris]KUG60908.1 hypothetical protein AVL61_09810 [Kocuria polaris]
MEQLRLAGVHDDGEHLVVEDEAGTRHLLRIDQELRLAVQRARRLPGARQRGTGQFGPREIQARFRAGATVEEIVAESGWESARVRRYEWPILAERAHVAAEAQKVQIEDRSAHRGYHSVFEGEPLTLGRAVAHRAADLGVDPSSLEWDSWQREDHLWAVVARFSVVDPSAAPAHDEPLAEWLYNPANQSVRPANPWAESLTEPGPPDTPLGTGLGVLDGGLDPELTQLRRSAVEADDLLDVLQARRGQRIGEDADGDDALAEILGRGMGHVERRPRPLAAPEDSSVFDRPFQPATQFPEPDAAPEPAPGRAGAPAGGPDAQWAEDATGAPAEPAEEPPARNGAPASSPERARQPGPERTGRDDGAAPAADSSGAEASGTGTSETGTPGTGTPATVTPRSGADGTGTSPSEDPPGEDPADSTAPAAREGAEDSTAEEESAPERPRPRNKTAKARRSARSSVPSWDEIVFGSSSD